MEVLDASAFIEDDDPDGPTATVPGVREELEDAAAFRFDALTGGGMRVHSPDQPARDRVAAAAAETGDADVLSAVDAELLAAALELDATLVTDDYAMQNVADALDVPIRTVQREAIAERRDWQFQCQGCGRTFDEDHDRCPICGTELTRKNPS